MINSTLSSPRKNPLLCQRYNQVKKLQKSISLGIETMAAKFLKASDQIKRITCQIIEAVNQSQKTILKRLQEEKLLLIQKIDKKWSNFKGYALLMRRIYFGQSQGQVLPPLDLQSVREILVQFSKKEVVFEKIVEDFQSLKKMNMSQHERKQNYIQLQLRQRQKVQVMQQQDIEISPVKARLRKQPRNSSSKRQIKALHFDQIQFQLQFKETASAKISRKHQFSSLVGQNTVRVQQNKHLLAKQAKIEEKIKMITPLTSHDFKKISLSQAKSEDRQFYKRLNNIKSSDRLTSPKITTNNTKSYRQFRMSPKNSERLFLWEKIQSFNPKKETSLIKKSYKGCLQKLERQQLQYEKIRHTFQ